MKNMENLKKLKEKEFAEKADRSKNTISLLRKYAFVLAVIVAALMLFHAQKDYNNYAGKHILACISEISRGLKRSVTTTNQAN